MPSIEPMYSRFFALISLFAFAMFALVVSDNLLTLYVGWEIMGLCSYLLIGFWYGKESAREAAIKAFLTTRVGDMFMLLGLAALYTLTGTLQYAGDLEPGITRNTLDLDFAGLWSVLGRVDRLAALHRRGWQIRPIPAARLAAGCHGRPDPGFGHDPCRHHGFGGCLPGHALLPAGLGGLDAGRAADPDHDGDGLHRRLHRPVCRHDCGGAE